MPKTTKTSIRLSDELRETISKDYPNMSFTQALNKYVEASENMKKGVESTTQIETPHDKTKPPQITDYAQKETLKLGENEIPPCFYASLTVRPSKLSKEGLEYLAFCDNPQKTHLPRNRLIPISACQKCYERMKDPLKEINKLMRSYYCEESDPTPSNLSDLPCIKNPDFECPYGKKEIASEYPCPFIEHKEWRRLFSKRS